MNIQVEARHMQITDAIRDYAREKALKLERYYDRIITTEVLMDLDGGTPLVEVIVNASHNVTFIGKHRGEDMYGCIDNAMHKVAEQIRRHKDRIRDHKGPDHEAQSEAAMPPDEQLDGDE
ncbi:MAG: ribosome-associated translation inhibitor RaiA [Lysobacterales bacterium]|nr:MAG: ribosome-associated translation inhibitor RaiA [Xanthomonadales bacterium]